MLSTPNNDTPSTDPQEYARGSLLSKAMALYFGEGLRGKQFQKALSTFHQQQNPPADEEYLLQIYQELDTKDGEEKSPGTSLEQAIHEKDIQGVFAAAGELARIKARTDGTFSSKMKEIHDLFKSSIKMSELHLAISRAEREMRGLPQEKQDTADVAQNWALLHQNLWAYDEERKCWRMWNESYWQEEDERCSTLDKYAKIALQEAGHPVDSTAILNLFQRMAAAYCRRPFKQHPSRINFLNGTLDLDTMQLLPSSREDNFTYCLPYSYNPYGNHPTIDLFLEATIPDIYGRQAYMAHLGLALLRDTNLHRFLLLLGPTRSGKTVLLAMANLLCEMVTTGQAWEFAGASLFSRELEGKRSRYKWGNRRIVAIDELPPEALQEEELVKAMSAHSGVEMRGINKDEHDHNRWMPKLIMNANDTPSYKDISGAIRQRAIIIECPNGPIPEEQQNPHLFEKLLAPEIGAFAVTCLHYGLLALERGSYPRSTEMKKHLHEIGVEGNPLKGFIEEKLILDPEAKVLTGGVWEQYKSYCDNHGYHRYKLAIQGMSRALSDMHIGITKGKMRYDGKVERCLIGVRLRKDEDPEHEESFSDDTLLVDDVDAVLTTSKTSSTPLEGPEKPVPNGPLTMLTTFPPMNPHKEETQSQRTNIFSSSYRNSITKISSTSSTKFVGKPPEPPQGVDDFEKHRQHSVNIVNSPPVQLNGNGYHKDDGEEREIFLL